MNTKRISIIAAIALTLILGIGIGIIIGTGISGSKIGTIGELRPQSHAPGLELSHNAHLLQPGTLRAARLLHQGRLALAQEHLQLSGETL